MDSVRFLRFFGGTVNILLARMYEQGESFGLTPSLYDSLDSTI